MGAFLKMLVLAGAVLGGVLIFGLFAMVESVPEIPEAGEPDLSQIRIFLQNRDPRRLAPGEISAFTVEGQDIKMLLDYGLAQWHGGASMVTLREGEIDLRISAGLPPSPLGTYLNLHLELAQSADLLTVEGFRVGDLRLPAPLADWLMHVAHQEFKRFPEYEAVIDAINGFSITEASVNVLYQWQPDLMEQLSQRGRDFLLPEDEQLRLLAHASELARLTGDPDLPRSASLARLLGPMFRFAGERGADPVAENRATLVAMSLYMLGINVPKLLGLPEDAIPTPGRHHFTLSQRRDLAQHFVISAGVTASAGTSLAHTIGLLKELNDSQGGSGFSFVDLGADRAGVRLAELALADARSARRVQQALASGAGEDQFMADFLDLPESLSADAFAEAYGDSNSAAYAAVIEEIDRRIASTPLFQGL